MASTIGNRQNLREVFATKEPIKLQIVAPNENDTLIYDSQLKVFRNTQSNAVATSQTTCITEANIFFSSQF